MTRPLGSRGAAGCTLLPPRMVVEHREPAQQGVVVAPVKRDLDARLLRRLITYLEEDLGGAASIRCREAGMARRDCRPPTKDLVCPTEQDNDVHPPIMTNSLQSFPDSILLGSRKIIALVERHADVDKVLDQLLCTHYALRRLALAADTIIAIPSDLEESNVLANIFLK